MALWLPHAPAGQEDAGGRVPKRDNDEVVDLTCGRWWCRVALVGGETRSGLAKLLRGGWVLLDLPGKKGESRSCLATMSRSWKQGQERW
jgi:hypothetical protein